MNEYYEKSQIIRSNSIFNWIVNNITMVGIQKDKASELITEMNRLRLNIHEQLKNNEKKTIP